MSTSFWFALPPSLQYSLSQVFSEIEIFFFPNVCGKSGSGQKKPASSKRPDFAGFGPRNLIHTPAICPGGGVMGDRITKWDPWGTSSCHTWILWICWGSFEVWILNGATLLFFLPLQLNTLPPMPLAILLSLMKHHRDTIQNFLVSWFCVAWKS